MTCHFGLNDSHFQNNAALDLGFCIQYSILLTEIQMVQRFPESQRSHLSYGSDRYYSAMTRIEERIIIALDQDNFYCGTLIFGKSSITVMLETEIFSHVCLTCTDTGVERVLNPSLCGKPIGITQKSLLATTSYEARARGVTKLMSIAKALELVPDLVLVSGEDLTNYRTFSREVTRVVEALVGGGEREGRKMDRGVEKLGMDEASRLGSLVHANTDFDRVRSLWMLLI
jgi:hypothetical protein